MDRDREALWVGHVANVVAEVCGGTVYNVWSSVPLQSGALGVPRSQRS